MSHLVIIDGHAIAHRAYHSIPDLSKDGQPVNAIYGFYSMILSVIDTLKPDNLVVCLDSPGPTFRQTEYIGYRAQRKPADHNLVLQLPLLPATLLTANIKFFVMGGYEADDLIGSIATKALKKISSKTKKKLVTKVTIITGDKDLMQLVNQKISLFVPIRGLSETKIFGPQEVKEKMGVNPDQIIDLKALMGDSSDNYPGVGGIGPKTAVDLLNKYGNLDQIYNNLSEINQTVRDKLKKDSDNAYLSQKLATIISNIPVKFSLKSTKISPKTYQGLEKLFSEYNFKSLLSRLKKNDPNQTKQTKKVVNSNQESLF